MGKRDLGFTCALSPPPRPEAQGNRWVGSALRPLGAFLTSGLLHPESKIPSGSRSACQGTGALRSVSTLERQASRAASWFLEENATIFAGHPRAPWPRLGVGGVCKAIPNTRLASQHSGGPFEEEGAPGVNAKKIGFLYLS